MPNKPMESYTPTMRVRDPHSTQALLIPPELQLARGQDYTHTLENFGLGCSTHDQSIIFEKAISKFSLCCMKARPLRQFIIHYLNFMLHMSVSFE